MDKRAANKPSEVDIALSSAASKGHLDVVKFLVGQGAQVDGSKEDGVTHLCWASCQGHLDVVKYLISQGAHVNGGDNTLMPPLVWASYSGHLDVVQYLVSQGAHVEMGNNEAFIPLNGAAKEGHLDVVKYLVGHGAQVERGDSSGWTPLHNASADGHINVVQYLVSQGAQVESSMNTGETPLLFASTTGHLDVVQYLVSEGAQLDRVNNAGVTSLSLASSKGHLGIVQYLVSQGAQIESGNNNGDTPLHFASLYGHLGIVQYLVSQGAQVERGNNEGDTPLNRASHKGHLDVVKYLIGHGAQINMPAIKGPTPLSWASKEGHLDVVEYLVGHGAQVERGDSLGWTPLHAASAYGHINVVQYLVSQGAQLDRGNTAGYTPLQLASNDGHLDVVRYLTSEQAKRKASSHEGSASVSEASTAMGSMNLNVLTDNVFNPKEDEYSEALADEEAKRVTPPQDQESLEPHSDTTLGSGLNAKEADDTDNNEGNDDQLTSLTHDPGTNRDDISFGGLSSPPEILARGARARRAYAEAAQAGTKKVFRTRLMLVGQERVGKTSLKKTLTGQRFDQNEAMTNGVETTNACEICIEVAKAGGKMWSIHKKGYGNEDTKEDEYSEALADDIAKRLIVTPSQNQESLEPHNDNTCSRDLNTKGKEDVHDPNTEGFVLDKVEAPKANKEDDNMPNHIASLVERMLKKQVHLKEIGTDSTDSGREERVSLSIWDFAGHDIYYTTHQVFLTWRAIYVIVFDLSRSLNSVVPPESRDKYYEMAKGGAKSELTCLEFINFWLCSIFAHAVAPSSVMNKDTSKTTQKSPPIFIVGTHRESVQGNAKEKKEKIGSAFGKIRESIKKRPFECHVVPKYYAIENSLEDKDEEVVELREHIEKVAMEEPYMGEEIPLRWLLFEDTLAADKANHMSLDQTKELTQPFGMESEGELLTMLTFYHDLGYIVYYGGIEDQQSLLRNMVILNPQWLIDVFKQVITILDPAEMDGILSDAWTTLQKDGMLEDRLIQHMWQGFLEQKEALVELMAKFDLICEAPVERLQQEQQDGVDTEVSNATGKVEKKRYYVPSRLMSHCSPEEIAQIKSSTDFYVDFRGFVTDGLFHRLMSRTVRWMRERDGQPVNLFYRHISLMVDEEHHALIEMLPPREATIKVTVFKGTFADSDHDGDNHQPPAPSAVKEVMDFVTETLDSLIQHWSRRIEYEVRFMCPRPNCSEKKALKDCKGMSLKCGLHNIRTAPIKIKFGITKPSLGNTTPTSPRPVASTEVDTPPQGTSAAGGDVLTSTARIHLEREDDFDDILKHVARRIPDNTKIDSLGKALGFDPDEIERYIATNTRYQHVTYDGTLKMLRDWRNKQTAAEERPALADALKLAGLARLTDMFLRNSKVPDLQTGE